MKIAVISDIHENRRNLQMALNEIEERGIEQIICLGDFINPGIARVLADSKIPVFAIWGNNDGDVAKILNIASGEGSNLKMSENTFDKLELGGKKIFITHYEDFAESIAKSGDYDAVFYGHTHNKDKKNIGNCLLLNPGELSTHKTGIASYAIYDTETNNAEIFDLENSFNTKWEDVDYNEKGRFVGKK